MGDCVVEGVEEVPLVGEVVEGSDGFEKLSVARSQAFEEHGDASRFEFGDDLAERLSTGRIEDLDLRETQDHDLDVAHRGELREELLSRAEEQCAVQPVDDDVLVQEPSLFTIGHRLVE